MPATQKALEAYRRRRDFSRTGEPRGRARRASEAKGGGLAYVVQKHKARRLHYDFRLELDGALKSWAVAKGPSLVDGEKRLAVHVEDHPLEYGDFEGNIPEGEYGAGTVITWDRGRWIPEGDPAKGFAKGHLSFVLEGEKLKGLWHMVRMHPKRGQRGDNWLLIKAADEAARAPGEPDILDEEPASVVSGKDVGAIAKDPSARRWTSGKPAAPAVSTKGLTPRQRARQSLRQSQAAPKPEPPAKAAKRKLLRLKIPKGARKRKIPDFIEPCLATAAPTAPQGAKWIHEVKFDGYRLLARRNEGAVTLKTRGGLDWTARFPPIKDAAAALPAQSAILDGEAVVEDKNGISDFAALQGALKAGRTQDIVFYVFDLLYLNGHDLTGVPLLERKAVLEELLGQAGEDATIRFSAQFESGDGRELLQRLCQLGGEGLVSKRADKPYRSGRSADWLKIKCANRQEFVVVGYVPSTSAPKAIGSLVLGFYDNKKLMHAGRAGTGYNLQMARELFTALKKIGIDAPAIEGPLPALAKRDVRWVEPRLVAEVEFRGWTAANMVRQASFKGLRDDKAPSEVVREPLAPASTAHGPSSQPANVRLTHPDRLLWPEAGFTKQALADYYSQIWPLMAPHIADRPLALLRCPHGIGKGCFFQKHLWQGSSEHIVPVDDPEDPEPLVSIADLEGLISLVQADVTEIHPWGSAAKALDKPDRLIFDLDPGEGIGWGDLVAAAKRLRDRLHDDKLESFVKTSGGKGLHVLVPLIPRARWEEAKEYSRELAEAMARDNPAGLTATMSKRARPGRIYVDYLRNARGSTAIAPYSPRARPSAGVSMPLAWEELELISGADYFTLGNASRRLQNLHADPWRNFAKTKQRLPSIR